MYANDENIGTDGTFVTSVPIKILASLVAHLEGNARKDVHSGGSWPVLYEEEMNLFGKSAAKKRIIKPISTNVQLRKGAIPVSCNSSA